MFEYLGISYFKGYFCKVKVDGEIYAVDLGEDNRPSGAIRQDMVAVYDLGEEEGTFFTETLRKLGYERRRDQEPTKWWRTGGSSGTTRDDGSWQYDAVLARAR